MLFSISLAVGLLIGGILLVALRPRTGVPSEASPRIVGITAIALGLVGVVALSAGMFLRGSTVDNLMPLAVAFPFAAVLFSGGSLIRGWRGWALWVGLALGLAPAVFWVVFVVAEVVGPAH